jgi:hypothetical protein
METYGWLYDITLNGIGAHNLSFSGQLTSQYLNVTSFAKDNSFSVSFADYFAEHHKMGVMVLITAQKYTINERLLEIYIESLKRTT